MAKRRKAREIFIGPVPVGGGSPVTVQSMTKTHTDDIAATVGQVKQLAKLGCHIIRVAVPNVKAANAIREIRPRIPIPLVADIHFSADLAIGAIKSGCDAVRINPGNMRNWRDVRRVVTAAKRAGISVRIGVNSGSIRERKGWDIKSKQKEKDLVTLMVDTTLKYCERFEKYGFRDIKLSLKTPDVLSTMECYRRVAKRCDYPLHLGLTAAGPKEEAAIKSAIAIGGLLSEGIGDTIRVSSTGRPHDEVVIGHQILRAVGLERRGLTIYSCPTCGRCEVDLAKIVREVKRKTAHIDRDVTIAIMGCIVNGPGEAAEADIGVACGKGFAYLFKNGKRLRRITPDQIVPRLLDHLKRD